MFPATPAPIPGIGAAPSADRISKAYAILAAAWPPELPMSEAALYSVLAVSGLESSYGSGFGEGINNWGAIQCGHGPPCGDACIRWGDSHADGSGYEWCYKRYPTPGDGAADLARLLAKRVGIGVLSSGSPDTLAAAMYDAHYYEGSGPDRESRIAGYAKNLRARYADIVSALGAASPARPPTAQPGQGQAGRAQSGGSGLYLLGLAAFGGYLLKRRVRGG